MAPSMGIRNSIGSPISSPMILELGEDSSAQAGGPTCPRGLFDSPASQDDKGASASTGLFSRNFTGEEDFTDFRELIGRLEEQYIQEMILLNDENRLLKAQMAQVMGGGTDDNSFNLEEGEEPPAGDASEAAPIPNQTFEMSAVLEPNFRPGPQVHGGPLSAAEGSQNSKRVPSVGLPPTVEEPVGHRVSRESEAESVVMGSAATNQMIAKIDADVEASKEKRNDCASRLESDIYEITIGMLIIVNSVIMAIEFEYQGYVVGHDLNYRRMEGHPDQVWAHAENVFYTINLVFTIAFVVDIALRLTFLRLRFFKLTFNWLDLVVVLSSVAEILFQDLIPVDTVFMRMLRLGKVARAMRVVRHSEGMSSLIMMIKCVTWALLKLF
ncbi:scn4aa [Symbiodinium pilosum]|uniref:Scn4aa protein n=1 Tax=Symbiodinium pilosum TaxID=2952 RepID=A0A812J3F2_SYMPI|nr:scn4aa [Symbiodinium pilosum]